jgi:predicted RNase H-like nuclease
MTRQSAVLGVDGCPGGWVGALVEGTSVAWLLLPDAAAVLAVDAAAVGIDMPIGLPAIGPRACDVAARRLLGARRSSVFQAPVRAVVAASSYAEARGLSVAASGRSLSAQTWNLVPRIRDLDTVLTDHARVVEVHPEVVFARLAGELPPKKTAAGAAARLAALRTWIPSWPAPPRPARLDDALDALACAWTAARWLRGEAEVLGDELDETGTPMRIVI